MAKMPQNNQREAGYDLIVLLERKVLYRFEGSETKVEDASPESARRKRSALREAERPTRARGQPRSGSRRPVAEALRSRD